jgi:hypothetical protein
MHLHAHVRVQEIVTPCIIGLFRDSAAHSPVFGRLTAMGFDEVTVARAVEAASGDEDTALDILLGGSQQLVIHYPIELWCVRSEPDVGALNDAFFLRFHPQFQEVSARAQVHAPIRSKQTPSYVMQCGWVPEPSLRSSKL